MRVCMCVMQMSFHLISPQKNRPVFPSLGKHLKRSDADETESRKVQVGVASVAGGRPSRNQHLQTVVQAPRRYSPRRFSVIHQVVSDV